jgi:BirA family transcriptional regulator, biotin operon repressor / biotin---[acetyl-CoA-carboxylase] ligase
MNRIGKDVGRKIGGKKSLFSSLSPPRLPVRGERKENFSFSEEYPFILRNFDLIDSTNSEAKRDAERGAEEGTVYLATRQSQGRGREDRTWHSEDTGGIYCSVLFRPAWPVSDGLLFVKFSALAVYDTILNCMVTKDLTLPALHIKPPNDILLSGRKLSGILVESASQGQSIRYVVVGMGINVNQTCFPAEIAERATSLRLTYGISFDQDHIFKSILKRLWSHYLWVEQHGPESIMARWNRITGEME